MAEEADVQASKDVNESNEITLDDFNADEPNVAKAESSPAEDKKPEVVEKPKEEAESKTQTEPEAKTEPEDKVEAEAETVAEPDKPQTKADERKTQLNTEIRDLVAQRNALKQEVEKANGEVYQVATEEELVEGGLTATDAKVEALRQKVEMRDYNDKVAEAQLVIGSEAERVIRDFPIFNPESDDYDEELAAEAGELLQANLVLDQNTGQIIGSNVSPYQMYKTLARASGISAQKGQIKGQQATERQLANVDAGTTAAPAVKAKDPLMELWTSD